MEHIVQAIDVVVGTALVAFGAVSVWNYLKLLKVAPPPTQERLRIGLTMQAVTIYIAAYVVLSRGIAIRQDDPLTFRDFGAFTVLIALVIATVVGTVHGRRHLH
jgi:hypothetical protein